MKKMVTMLLALMMAVSFILPAMAEDTIKIGLSGPLTGPYARFPFSLFVNTRATRRFEAHDC